MLYIVLVVTKYKGGQLMDAQLKRGSLDVCVLAALTHGDSYGYHLVQDLNDVLDINESTLYPILKRLEKNGLVKTYAQEANGRLRHFYAITKSGYTRILEYLEDFQMLLKVYNYIEKEVKNYEE